MKDLSYLWLCLIVFNLFWLVINISLNGWAALIASFQTCLIGFCAYRFCKINGLD